MREREMTPDPERSRVTRMLESDSESSESSVWDAPLWNPYAQLQPLVIVIDDSPAVRRVVEICLGREGISTASFASGIEAVAALTRGDVAPPKVLLLDIGMPRMNGYDVARTLKSNPAFRDIKIFMLTGHDGMLDRALARLLGAGFIPKPFKSHVLLTIVCEALGIPVPDNRWR
jgi:twitching motility two-component system response regulator PilG